MPQIPNSGAISLADFATEFGGTAPHSMSEYYRDGGNVPSNNSNVPTSGAFRFGHMRGAINAIINTLANTTNVNLATLFGDNWASSVPKEIIIPSGVTIGGTGSSDALTAPSGMGGTLTITNAGSVIGFGGTSGGGGGNAIRIASSGITVANSGLIAGGGGGGGIGGAGGAGGTGGQGRYTYVGCSQNTRCSSSSCSCSNCGGNQCVSGCSQSTQAGPMDSIRYVAQTICGQLFSGGAGGAGGSEGSGGLGQGYNQSATSGSTGSAGSAGSAGASNGGSSYGGTGGTGGTGGNGGSGASYGQSGSSGTSGTTGSTAANGNYTNGSAGSDGSSGGSGGAAGAAVIYTVAYTMNNTGTLAGAA